MRFNHTARFVLSAMFAPSLLLHVGCAGRLVDDTRSADAGDASAGSPSDDGGPPVVGPPGGQGEGTPTISCSPPTLPKGYFCDPPGGTNSTAFDPIACGVNQPDGGGAACAAQCAAWFDAPPDSVWCVPADGYLDAGPPGSVVCVCNIP
jgi:hypothetical protein